MPGSSEMVLMAQVARRFYLGRQSKTQIADDLGISRFRVARLLTAAVDQQVVRFEVGIPGRVDLGLSAELRETYGLSHCVVTDPPDEEVATLRRHVGITAAELLGEIITDSDVLGLASSRILMGLEQPLTRFARCPVVQITGALSRPDALDVMDTVRWFTRTGGGPAFVFYAPLICRDVDAVRACKNQVDVLRCMDRFDDISTAVVGVGAWKSGQSTVYDASPPAEQRRCRDLGVQVEVAGMLLDADGAKVSSPLSDRVLGMSDRQFRAVRTRIGVAAGVGRANALRIALGSGLINGLVTHSRLAEAVLSG